MFDQVMDEAERAELLVCIKEWEAANPGVDSAHRVTGWIDVAYDLRARKRGTQETRQRVRVAQPRSDWSSVGRRITSATA